MSSSSSSSSSSTLLLPVSTIQNKNFTQLKQTHSSLDYHKYPGATFEFQLEHRLIEQIDLVIEFCSQHPILPLALCFGYYLSIGQLQQAMEKRQPFKLRIPLILWNTALALFSIMGSIRVLPELYWAINKFGLAGSCCANLYYDDLRVFLWMYLFGYSKVAELGDTMFIVLRKQRLITLHWVHHIVTLLYCWYVLPSLPGNSRWFCTMNFVVHSVMYSYYAVMATGYRIPKHVAIYITTMQIVQMIIGTTISVHVLWSCPGSQPLLAQASFAMYLLFFVLFVKFFLDKYYFLRQDSGKSKAGPRSGTRESTQKNKVKLN